MQEVLQRVHDNGHTLPGHLRGLVLPALRRLQDRERDRPGNPCPIHEIALDREQEENWFFRLSAFQEPLERLFAERPDFVMPRHHFNEARSFVEQGLARRLALARGR